MLKYADWIVVALNIYSYYLIGNQNKIGFILGIIGCILGIVLFSTILFSAPMIIMNGLFGVLNLINYVKWANKLKLVKV